MSIFHHPDRLDSRKKASGLV